ncbi:MAG: PP2C family serine/threonine-protein phosphatase, partial [Desulfobulbia bacterium]
MHATQPTVQVRTNSIVRVDRKTFGATVRGCGHVRNGKPNQDAYRIVADEENSVYVAVVSDGAGSAPNSQEGALECVNFLAEKFLTIGVDLVRGKLHHKHVENKILHAILQHTSNIEAKGGKLRDYHHTLSAVIVTATGGRVIMIGDSPIIVTVYEDSVSLGAAGDLALAFSKAKIFEETKLEYANETHFVTQSIWDNLKISSLPKKFGAIFLMTDGAGAGYISRGAVHEPSMLAMMSEVLASPDIAAKTVEKYLSHPALDEITADDKTFVGIIPSSWTNNNFAPKPKDLTPEWSLKKPLSTAGVQSKETSLSRPQSAPQQVVIDQTTNQSTHSTLPETPLDIKSSRGNQLSLHTEENRTSPFTKGMAVGGGLVLISVILAVVSIFSFMHYFKINIESKSTEKKVTAEQQKAQTKTGFEAKQTPVAEAKQTPVAEAKKTPNAEAKKTPVAEAKKTPVAEAKQTPVAQAKKTPDAQAKKTPDAEAKKTPDAQAKKTPDAEAKKTPDAQAKKTPDAEAKKTPDAQAKK